MMTRERYITVTDDWYPCYEGNKVRLRLSIMEFLGEWHVRLAAWGADDTAYVKDFDTTNREKAKEKYQEFEHAYNLIPNNIDKDWFIDRGFKRF